MVLFKGEEKEKTLKEKPDLCIKKSAKYLSLEGITAVCNKA